ncbi:MAG: twin-arginine translocase TatA/TatE family subunit [Candidatus Hydrogenedentota bacterium]
MFNLNFGEIIVIFIVALIFIGPKKLPELARSLGKGLKEFQRGAREFQDEIEASEFEEEIKKDSENYG